MIRLAQKNQTEACKFCKKVFQISEILVHTQSCEKEQQPLQQIDQIQAPEIQQSQQKLQQEHEQDNNQQKPQPPKKKMNVVGPVEVYVEQPQQTKPEPQRAQPQQPPKKLDVVNKTKCVYCDEFIPVPQFPAHEQNCDAKIRMEILIRDFQLVDAYQVEGSAAIRNDQAPNQQQNNQLSENGKIVAKYLELAHQHPEIRKGPELLQNAKWTSAKYKQDMSNGICEGCQKGFIQDETIYIMDCMHKYHKGCILERLKTSSKCQCGLELFKE